MSEPLLQRAREEVVVILPQGGERGAVRRAVRMQVMSALGWVEVTAVGVQQIAYDVMCGTFQAAEQAGKPIEIVGEEASSGVLEAVREKVGKAVQYLREAIPQKAGIEVERVKRRIEQELERLPKASTPAGPPDQVHVTGRLNRCLVQAEDEAKQLTTNRSTVWRLPTVDLWRHGWADES
jgi:hypothetical protein